MDYFAGLDISMDETHVCVLDREGVVGRESKAASTAEAIADELSKAPSCRRIRFETGGWRRSSSMGSASSASP
jgi:transposase